MTEKFLYLIATFDEETSLCMKKYENMLRDCGLIGTQTHDIPHHITLASYDLDREEEIKQRMQEVCSRTQSFDLSFNHIGLFGLKVLFLAPDVNYELLDLHKSFIPGNDLPHDWTAHATLLIDNPENIHKALDLVTQNFKQLKARVEGVSIYGIEPTRLIAECKLH